ncbi:hypothetical protein [Caulobacter endophyticus]|uniref:hypothetical protein n=1 Tax=Caulobacter endophyticus TaxID=2172652 RepID=UPI002410B0BB|nr:hypothetical protein [Caulobacter endophyticus]MDG2527957.1 hypothetical protein [Caulobacter endophyticus]
MYDLIFGAWPHEVGYWRDHPMVGEAEAHFDGAYGWVRLRLAPPLSVGLETVAAVSDTAEATRASPDLHFYGEGDCPLALFESAPRVRELRVWTEGPIEGDERSCWSVGIWLHAVI